VIAERPSEYNAWALRWLGRWIAEAPAATIELAAEVAAQLADLPDAPAIMERLREESV